MEDSRCRKLALGFGPQLTKIMKQRGVDRVKRKEELFDALENVLQNMVDECQYRMDDYEERHDKVQNNLLNSSGRVVELRIQNEVLRAEKEDLQGQVQWKDDELFRIIEENSEFKQLVSAVEDLKVIETEYDNNEQNNGPEE